MRNEKDKKPQDLYLSEDKDILDKLESMNIQTGAANAKQQTELQILQIKATLRNRQTMERLDSSANRSTIALLGFAGIQILVMLSQLILAAWVKNDPVSISVVIMCILGVCLSFIFIAKSIDKES